MDGWRKSGKERRRLLFSSIPPPVLPVRFSRIWHDAPRRARGAGALTCPCVDLSMRWPRPLPRLLRRLRSPLLVIGAALAAALLIRAVAVDAYRIPTASMEPALLPGDLVLVEKATLGARGPGPLARWRMPGLGTLRRGDVVVFGQPTQRRALAQKTAFVKRVVGLPGDTVEIRAGRLLVNGIPFEPTPTLRDWAVHAPLSPDAAPVRAAGCHAPTCAVRERLEPGQWRVAATDAAAAELGKTLDVRPLAPRRARSLFPLGTPQTLDDYGPVVVPTPGRPGSTERGELALSPPDARPPRGRGGPPRSVRTLSAGRPARHRDHVRAELRLRARRQPPRLRRQPPLRLRPRRPPHRPRRAGGVLVGREGAATGRPHR